MIKIKIFIIICRKIIICKIVLKIIQFMFKLCNYVMLRSCGAEKTTVTRSSK